MEFNPLMLPKKKLLFPFFLVFCWRYRTTRTQWSKNKFDVFLSKVYIAYNQKRSKIVIFHSLQLPCKEKCDKNHRTLLISRIWGARAKRARNFEVAWDVFFKKINFFCCINPKSEKEGLFSCFGKKLRTEGLDPKVRTNPSKSRTMSSLYLLIEHTRFYGPPKVLKVTIFLSEL